MESTMTYQNDDSRTDRARRNSPVGWAIGAIFVIAVVAAVFFYNGREFSPQATSTSPNNAPSVTTGSNPPATPAK
jgi:NADH:ubiquinone oxidoreductase subunit 6 (subunit J)